MRNIIKKAITMLLMVSMLVGYVPTDMFSHAAGTMPDSITLGNAEYGGSGPATYTSPNLTPTKIWIHIFTMNVPQSGGGSASQIGFCFDHTKHLGASYEGQTWNLKKTLTTGNMAADNTYWIPFVDFYYYGLALRREIDLAFPELTSEGDKYDLTRDQIIDRLGHNIYTTYWTEYMVRSMDASAQAAVWLTEQGKLAGASYSGGQVNFTDANLNTLAAERNAMFAAYGETPGDSVNWYKQVIGFWNAGGIPKNTYYQYDHSTNPSYVQPIVLAEPVVEDLEAYFQIVKTTSGGESAEGAEFDVQSSAGDVVHVKIGSDGKSPIAKIKIASTTDTLTVTETKAPTGYEKCKDQTIPFTISATVHTETNPATISINNKKEPEPHPEDGDLEIIKIDAKTGAPLAGAVFTIDGTTQDGDPIVGANYTTDTTGVVKLQYTDPSKPNYIAAGYYSVRETLAPDGYQKTDEVKYITIKSRDNLVQVDPDGTKHYETEYYDVTAAVTFEDYPYHNIELTKTDHDGNPIGGAEFDVYYNDAYYDHIVVSGNKALQYFGTSGKGLKTGFYKFVETKAPTGYLIPAMHEQGIFIDASNTSNPTHRITFSDSEYPEIKIIKRDSITGLPVKGATYEVLIDGAKVTDVTTNEAGLAVIGHDAYGSFMDDAKTSWTLSVREKSAAPKYNLDGNDDGFQVAELKAGQTLATFEYVNSPFRTVEVMKKNGADNSVLSGATFQLKSLSLEDGHGAVNLTATTDGSGVATFKDLPNGTYELKEIASPKGFNLNPEVKTVVIGTMSPKTLQYEFENFEYPEIIIHKTDSITGTSLKGAKYQVYIDNVPIKEVVTDASGKAVLTYEDYQGLIDVTKTSWTVKVMETGVPAGYNFDKNDVACKAQEMAAGSGSINFEYKNSPYRILNIIKKDGTTGATLKGATFQLKSVSLEDAVAPINKTATTDATGKAVFEQLPNGTYELSEITAPEGFNLNTEKKTIVIGTDTEATITYEYKNYNFPDIIIHKIDSITGEPVKGAKYKVFIDNVAIKEVITDATGYAKLTYKDYQGLIDITKASWTVKVLESGAAIGYNLDKNDIACQAQEMPAGVESITFEYKNSPYRTIKVIKKDAETDWDLAGATFKLHSLSLEDASYGTFVDRVLTTDAKGFVEFTDIPNGMFELTEITAPNGYEGTSLKYTITVSSDSEAVLTYEFKNEPKSGLLIRKVDSVTKLPLKGVKFKIEFSDGHGAHEEWEKLTDSNGSIVMENVKEGDYTAYEVSTIDGYVLDTTPKTITILNKHDANTLTFENNQKGALNILKIDSKTGLGLGGAIFSISTPGGKHIADVTTASNGYATYIGLVPGSYVVKEIKAPAGFCLDPNPQTFEIEKSDSGKIYTLVFSDTEGSKLYIVKHDRITGVPLSGAEFALAYQDGTVIADKLITDNKGIASVTKNLLATGTYYLKEVNPPEGYAVITESIPVYLEIGKSKTVDVYDEPFGVIRLFKVDGTNHQPVAGSEFSISTKENGVIETITTDKTGWAFTSRLEPGTYYVQEIKAPELYILNDKVFEVELKNGEGYGLIVENYKKTCLHLTLTGEYGETVGGAAFEIYDIHMNLIGTYATNEDGVFSTEPLIAGIYYIKNVTAAPGYLLINDMTKVEVVTGESNQVFLHCIPLTTLKVVLLDEITKNPLVRVEFKVETIDGHLIGTYETDENGEFTVANLLKGEYKVSIISTLSGYTMPQAQTINIEYLKSNHLDFFAAPYTSITIQTVSVTDKSPVRGSVIEVYKQNGVLIGTFTTDATGSVTTPTLESGYYVVKLIKTLEGYRLGTVVEKTVHIEKGISVTETFEVIPDAHLTVISVDNNGTAIGGMEFTLKTFTGEIIGTYKTDINGKYVITGLKAGAYIVNEVKAPDGFLIITETQNINITEGKSSEVIFKHNMIVGLEVKSISEDGKTLIEGAVYEITRLDGSRIGVFTSASNGIFFEGLEPGTYVITPKYAPAGWVVKDSAPRNVTVVANKVTKETFIYEPMTSVNLRFVDGNTRNGVYGFKVLIKDNHGALIGEYTSDNKGYISINKSLAVSGYTLTMISAPAGYTVDSMPRSIETLALSTTEAIWTVYKDAGQIQIVVTSEDYNATRNLPKGVRLEGAIFEITNADTYQIVGHMISDSNGIAASCGLPIGRYTIRQIAASPYYGINDKVEEVRLKIKNDTVQINWTEKSITLSTKLAHRSNTSVNAGSSFRVDLTAFENNSSVALANYYLHIKVPTDCARISAFTTGVYNYEAFYSIRYKTNMNDYRTLVSNLSSVSNHSYDFSTQALGLQAGEYVTDVMMCFDRVPAGFKATVCPKYMLYALSTVSNGYMLISRIEMGGSSSAVLQTTNGNVADAAAAFSGTSIASSSDAWTLNTHQWQMTIVNKPANLPSKLPKTGY